MSALVVALFFLIRVFLPLGLLLVIGEWVHRRERHYWLHS